MPTRLTILLLIIATAAGCARISESRFNPFNWFGGDEEVTATAPITIEDPRPLVDQVSRIAIDTAPGGAILRAVGLPPTQGYFEGALVLARSEPGVLTYAFRIVPPIEPSRVSTERSREVVVGLFLSDQTLEGVREIRVQGARNARGLRR